MGRAENAKWAGVCTGLFRTGVSPLYEIEGSAEKYLLESLWLGIVSSCSVVSSSGNTTLERIGFVELPKMSP